MATNNFRFDSGELRRGISRLEPELHAAVSTIVDFHALVGMAQMKEEAPWTDDTGAARAGLHSYTVHEPPRRHTIVLSHAVNYGIWLEVKNSGRYEIIMPTLLDTGRDLMRSLDHLMRDL